MHACIDTYYIHTLLQDMNVLIYMQQLLMMAVSRSRCHHLRKHKPDLSKLLYSHTYMSIGDVLIHVPHPVLPSK